MRCFEGFIFSKNDSNHGSCFDVLSHYLKCRLSTFLDALS